LDPRQLSQGIEKTTLNLAHALTGDPEDLADLFKAFLVEYPLF
jgi:hypothetical protein